MQAGTGTPITTNLFSYYYDTASGDSAELRGSLAANVVTLIATYRDFTVSASKLCTFKAGDTPTNLKLLNNILIGKDTDGWKTCVFTQNIATDLTETTLTVPFATANLIEPAAVVIGAAAGAYTLKVYASDSITPANSGFYDYPLAATPQATLAGTVSAATTTALVGLVFPAAPVSGTELLWVSSGNKCVKANTAITAWAFDTVCDPAAGQLSWGVGLTGSGAAKVSLLLNINTDLKTAGKVFYINAGTLSAAQTLLLGTSPYRPVTDYIRNVLIVGKENVYWLTVKYDNTNVVSTLVATPPTDLYDAKAITVATNKGFFLSPAGVIITQNTATGTSIDYIKTIALTTATADITAVTADKEYKFTSKCLSTAANTFIRWTCFGTSFNCVSTTKNIAVDGFKYAAGPV